MLCDCMRGVFAREFKRFVDIRSSAKPNLGGAKRSCMSAVRRRGIDIIYHFSFDSTIRLLK